MKKESRAAQVRRAEAVLLSLLRTPKTRPGLVAAVSGRDISRNFVFGWLVEQVRNGGVVKLKSAQHVSYQIATTLHTEVAYEGVYPSWLESRALPSMVARRIYIDGRPAGTQKEE